MSNISATVIGYLTTVSRLRCYHREKYFSQQNITNFGFGWKKHRMSYGMLWYPSIKVSQISCNPLPKNNIEFNSLPDMTDDIRVIAKCITNGHIYNK